MRRMIILTLALGGCASSGIVPMDKGTFMITKKSAGGAFVSGDEVKAELYTEANAHCAKTGQAVETIKAEGKNAVPFVRATQATIEFRCVKL